MSEGIQLRSDRNYWGTGSNKPKNKSPSSSGNKRVVVAGFPEIAQAEAEKLKEVTEKEGRQEIRVRTGETSQTIEYRKAQENLQAVKKETERPSEIKNELLYTPIPKSDLNNADFRFIPSISSSSPSQLPPSIAKQQQDALFYGSADALGISFKPFSSVEAVPSFSDKINKASDSREEFRTITDELRERADREKFKGNIFTEQVYLAGSRGTEVVQGVAGAVLGFKELVTNPSGVAEGMTENILINPQNTVKAFTDYPVASVTEFYIWGKSPSFLKNTVSEGVGAIKSFRAEAQLNKALRTGDFYKYKVPKDYIQVLTPEEYLTQRSGVQTTLKGDIISDLNVKRSDVVQTDIAKRDLRDFRIVAETPEGELTLRSSDGGIFSEKFKTDTKFFNKPVEVYDIYTGKVLKKNPEVISDLFADNPSRYKIVSTRDTYPNVIIKDKNVLSSEPKGTQQSLGFYLNKKGQVSLTRGESVFDINYNPFSVREKFISPAEPVTIPPELSVAKFNPRSSVLAFTETPADLNLFKTDVSVKASSIYDEAQDSRVKPVEAVEPFNILKVNQAQETKPMSETIGKSSTKVRSITAQAIDSAQETSQKTEQAFSVPRVPFYPRVNLSVRAEPPKRIISPPIRFKSSKPFSSPQSFIAEVKRGGVFIPASSEGQSYESAFKRGADIVNTTARASFRLRNVNTGEVVSPQSFKNPFSNFAFGRSKKSRNVLVEKPKFRINTAGELREITYKGIFASKGKSKRRKSDLWRL